MESVIAEQKKLEENASISKCIDDVQALIDRFKEAGKALENNPESTSHTLESLPQASKKQFEQVNEDVKKMHHGIRDFGKAVDKHFRDPKPLPLADSETLSSQQALIDRAISLHLNREGHFSVSRTFRGEANTKPQTTSSNPDQKSLSESEDNAKGSIGNVSTGSVVALAEAINRDNTWMAEFSPAAIDSKKIQGDFEDMYDILDQIQNHKNLRPAIAWAKEKSPTLEARGSNLEFDLCKLQYMWLFTKTRPGELPLDAVNYAKEVLIFLPKRYEQQIQELWCAISYHDNLEGSPYARIFQDCNSEGKIKEVCNSFTSEFCINLDLASASPLLSAVTAGCIALPTLQKFSQIQAHTKTSWTTEREMPIEIPLPPEFAFHSIFVCPVSKEQGTDENPPKRLPCGHVLARESIEKIAKGSKFKCPYCPQECYSTDAQRIYL